MLSADKVSEIFCIADDFCQEFDHQIENLSLPLDGKKHRRRKGQMSDSEIMTILICFHFNTYRNFKHYYLCYVKGYLKEYFPNAVSYNRFVELESRVAVQMALFLELFCFGECTGISFIDSTCIPVCHNKRIKRNKVFKGYAAMGKSTMGWFYGFKLHLICNERGELINFMLRKRSVIETVNDELKNVAQAVHSRHRSVFNFAMNMLAALAAYCFFDKKPAINCDFCIEGSNGQLTLFN